MHIGYIDLPLLDEPLLEQLPLLLEVGANHYLWFLLVILLSFLQLLPLKFFGFSLASMASNEWAIASTSIIYLNWCVPSYVCFGSGSTETLHLSMPYSFCGYYKPHQLHESHIIFFDIHIPLSFFTFSFRF